MYYLFSDVHDHCNYVDGNDADDDEEDCNDDNDGG